MQKGQGLIFIIVGILVAAIIAGGAYYLGRSTAPKPSPNPIVASQTPQSTPSPSPSDTSDASNGDAETTNWKTYTNEGYKFTLQYPTNVTYKNEEYNGGNPPDNKNLAIVFNINEGSLRITPNNPFEGYDPEIAFTDGTLESHGVSISDIIIDGIKTEKLLFPSKTKGNIRKIASPLGDKIYFNFTLPQDESERIKVDKLINQILATFKFL